MCASLHGRQARKEDTIVLTSSQISGDRAVGDRSQPSPPIETVGKQICPVLHVSADGMPSPDAALCVGLILHSVD